jgi:hypothetical protein
MDVVGEAYNTDKNPVVAISYGQPNDSQSEKYSNFVNPQIVQRLPDQMQPAKQGPLEAVEEVIL